MDDLLNDAPCGFVSFAEDGKILETNATLLRLLDYARPDLQGCPIGYILSAGSHIFYQTHLFPLLELNHKIDEIYLSLRSRGGKDVPVLVNAVRRQRDGAAVSNCILVPIHQRIQYEDGILREKRGAEEAVRAMERAQSALIQANEALEEANVELESQQEKLCTQQEHLLELQAELHDRARQQAP